VHADMLIRDCYFKFVYYIVCRCLSIARFSLLAHFSIGHDYQQHGIDELPNTQLMYSRVVLGYNKFTSFPDRVSQKATRPCK